MLRIKICGICDLSAAQTAAEAGADYLGFHFCDSARRVSPEDAKAVIDALDVRPGIVGVFIDEDPEVARQVAEFVGLDLLQLHGSEAPGYDAGRPVMKVLKGGDDRVPDVAAGPETLMGALEELENVWHEAKADPQFQLELAGHRHAFVGRPTPLYSATRLGEHFGGAHIHLKREDLCHTGAHKLNNAVGQALLALRMGKKRLIAETGAGQHGVAAAPVAASFGLECTVYMGTEDMRRQSMNVRRMKLLGAQVGEVTSGTKTLKDATSEAIRDWVSNVRTAHYIIGSVVGPHPYPEMVRDLQRVIGDEARDQYLSVDGKLPDVVVACVGGGSNPIGIFTAFLQDKDVLLVGVESAGKGVKSGQHAASLLGGRPGVLHGSYS